ncbi:MAG: zinc-ribbon domain-containing protein [Defluviitaleaceae bacterium]|nr:zinc-ribbon domain-containing protein [Defluviitaleaceae bacterium]MCL2273651.1 zinc-ribbon domain-containing protein [Defluviitaleaceae bacterium]
MFCHKCGEKIPENTKFCIKCGTNLSTEESPASKGIETPPNVHSSVNTPNPNSNKMIGIIAAAVLVPIIAIVAFFALRSEPENAPSIASVPNAPTHTTPTEPPAIPTPTPPVVATAPAVDEEEWILVEDWGFSISVPSSFYVTAEGVRNGLRLINEPIEMRVSGDFGPSDLEWLMDYNISIQPFDFNDGNVGYLVERDEVMFFANINTATLVTLLHGGDISIFHDNAELIWRIAESLTSEFSYTPQESVQNNEPAGQTVGLDVLLVGEWVEQGDAAWLSLTRTFNPDGTGYWWGDGPGQTFTWWVEGNVLTMDVRCEAFEDEWTDVFRYEIVGNTMTFTHADGWQRVYARQ